MYDDIIHAFLRSREYILARINYNGYFVRIYWTGILQLTAMNKKPVSGMVCIRTAIGCMKTCRCTPNIGCVLFLLFCFRSGHQARSNSWHCTNWFSWMETKTIVSKPIVLRHDWEEAQVQWTSTWVMRKNYIQQKFKQKKQGKFQPITFTGSHQICHSQKCSS